MAIKEATDATFEELVLKNDKPVVVDFWAVWCGPCKLVAPEMEKIAEKYEGVVDVVKVDVDANPGLSQAYQIMSIPTIAYFKPGDQPKGVVGFQPMEQLEQQVRADRAQRPSRLRPSRPARRARARPDGQRRRAQPGCPGITRGIVMSGAPRSAVGGPGLAPPAWRQAVRNHASARSATWRSSDRGREADPARLPRRPTTVSGVRSRGFGDVGRQPHLQGLPAGTREIGRPRRYDRTAAGAGSTVTSSRNGAIDARSSAMRSPGPDAGVAQRWKRRCRMAWMETETRMMAAVDEAGPEVGQARRPRCRPGCRRS